MHHCPQCGEPWDEEFRRPRVLYCGHVFCEPCLQAHLNADSIRCSICSKPTSVHKGDLSYLILVKNLLESSVSQTEVTPQTQASRELVTAEVSSLPEFEEQSVCQDEMTPSQTSPVLDPHSATAESSSQPGFEEECDSSGHTSSQVDLTTHLMGIAEHTVGAVRALGQEIAAIDRELGVSQHFGGAMQSIGGAVVRFAHPYLSGIDSNPTHIA
eukprot:gnl/MRDRNA2_/MRDRNA2_307811_c0_seq1.p1 gnl/MRDRNA2_/MRDRNA2_307811_c0~~gnl/MRDRNA2_/MRDRNA2_307811_c0_seq1.p1  ORF type:complete len:213 (-),score=30.93 gnl/MRDRNA2_/MRDRNA2_307811_c0_seq1:31-669(-)